MTLHPPSFGCVLSGPGTLPNGDKGYAEMFVGHVGWIEGLTVAVGVVLW